MPNSSSSPNRYLSPVEEQRRRVQELRAVRDCLLPNADDPHVMSELTAIELSLVAAHRELALREANARFPAVGVPPLEPRGTDVRAASSCLASTDAQSHNQTDRP